MAKKQVVNCWGKSLGYEPSTTLWIRRTKKDKNGKMEKWGRQQASPHQYMRKLRPQVLRKISTSLATVLQSVTWGWICLAEPTNWRAMRGLWLTSWLPFGPNLELLLAKCHQSWFGHQVLHVAPDGQLQGCATTARNDGCNLYESFGNRGLGIACRPKCLIWGGINRN